MSEDLQSLLEKINRDGVEKAEAEAAKIVAAAKEKADALIKSAREEAAKCEAQAKQSAETDAARAAETIRQAARDTVISVQGAVTALLEKLLTKDVEKSLADETAAAALVQEVIRGFATTGEIAAAPKLAQALKARTAALGSFQVVTDETLGTGFSVKLDGGRVEHAFTAEVIASELAKRLRPELAALLK